jgi:hypothetical protein
MKNIFGTSFIMTNDTKLAFSALEAELIQNSEWILTKQSALLKIEELFAKQVPLLQNHMAPLVSAVPDLLSVTPKISRGEKYRGLPWLMLDYPAIFSKESVFAVRTMFWWGHFFSVTLHLSGEYKKIFWEKLENNIVVNPLLLYVSVGETEWEHHYESDNYLPLSQVDPELAAEKPFIKLSLQFSLDEWKEIDIHLAKAYRHIFELIQ